MSRKALEMEHLSLFRGCSTGTWREGSYTEDCKGRHGNRAFPLWDSIRHLALQCLVNMFIRLEPALDIFFCHV
jgi:hypothetical protein